jgi:hypothetical protein
MLAAGCIFTVMKNPFLLLVFLAFFLGGCTNHGELLNDPQPGDIYILEEEGIYYPMKIDSVAAHEVYMVNSKFMFTDAIPQPEDLPDGDFDYGFHLIYEPVELKRLFNEGALVEIYRGNK